MLYIELIKIIMILARFWIENPDTMCIKGCCWNNQNHNSSPLYQCNNNASRTFTLGCKPFSIQEITETVMKNNYKDPYYTIQDGCAMECVLMTFTRSLVQNSTGGTIINPVGK
jgi:hypothetical protein